MKQYEVFRKGGQPGKVFANYENAVAELVSRLPRGLNGYEYKRRGGETWYHVKTKRGLKRVLNGKTLAIGEAFWARRNNGEAIFVLRAIEVVVIPDCPDPAATPAVKALWDATYRAYLDLGPGYEFVYMGIFNCRKIDGSVSWSQHAFHNALDFRIRRKDADPGSIDATATSKVVNKVENQAAETLWLTTGHYFHAHLTGDPKRSGTPPCA